jgi:glycogen(starch) synthase
VRVVVFCPPFGGIGGIESVARHVVAELARAGHAVTVVSRGPEWREEEAPVRRVVVPMRQFPRRTRHLAALIRFVPAFVPVVRRLARVLRTGPPPDVVLSLAPPNYSPYVLGLAAMLGRPLVAGLHSDPAHLERHANRGLHRRLLRRAARLVACSERVAAAAAAEVPACRAKLVVVPNGYDPAEIDGARALRGDRPFILAVARLVPEKGIDVLVDAFALIAAEFPSLDLVVAGDGPERGRLDALAAARGLGGRVRFAGFTDRPTTVGLLLGAELVCCPSRWESFSLVALEAAAAGKAVVAAAAGALPELVRDGETGVLVPSHEPAAWAGALRSLLADPTRAATLGARARARARELTWARVGARYAEALASVRPAG